MKMYLGSSVCLWIFLAMPLAAGTVRIWAGSSAGAEISVIDPTTNKVVQTIESVEVPSGEAFSADGGRAYVGDGVDNTLAILDTKTGKIIKKVPLTGKPNLPAVSKDGKRIFVCINQPPPLAAVDIVDAISLQKVKTIPIRGGMHDCYVTQDGKYLIAGAPFEKFAAVIDLRTDQVAWELLFDRGVLTMTIESNPDGSAKRLFVQLVQLDGFAVVDFAQRKEVARIEFPKDGLGVHPKNYNGVSHGAGIAPDGKTFWINSGEYNAVFAYSLPDLKPLGHVVFPAVELPGHAPHPPITSRPQWIDFTPDGKTLFDALANHNSVMAIDVKTMKIVGRIPLPEAPAHVTTVVLP